MSDCCCAAPKHEEYEYDPSPGYVVGEVGTLLGAVPRATTELSRRDKLGTARVRWNIGRMEYRVRPGLYAVGEPDDTAPVLVTANYKLSFDAVRRTLTGRDAWLLVLNTNGINVWCAAGKGTFGTDELVRRIRESHLEQVVSHGKLVLPQLSATGVAAHEVRTATGFRVVYGPVRASDIPAFLDSGMKTTAEMRRVRFTLRDRAALVGVELSFLWRPWMLLVLGVLALLSAGGTLLPGAVGSGAGAVFAAIVLAVVAGAVIVPLLLPWLPGRAFALKGAIVGAAAVGALSLAGLDALNAFRAAGLALGGTALSSFVAMNFTGSSTFTSPSGVEWEMRRAIPLQVTGAALFIVLWIVGLAVRGA